MKTSFVPFTALPFFLLLSGVTGCGVFSDASAESDGPESDAPVAAPVRPSEPPAPLEGTPAISELDESFGVFVIANANPGGDGTRARPFGTIAEGIAAAKIDGKRVYVCEGTFEGSIVIEDGISMLGGLDCSLPSSWKIGTGRSRIVATSIPAITVANITKATRFVRFEVTTPDATKPGESSIAIFAKGASLLTFDRARIASGNGAKGDDGVDPAPASPGANVDGKLAPAEGPWSASGTGLQIKTARPGGEAGTSACGAPSGGLGGSGGLWEPNDSSSFDSGWHLANSLTGPTSGEAGAGAVKNGSDGQNATSTPSFTRDGFVPANGTRGTNGSPGVSGSGGSGHGPTQSGFGKSTWHGAAGSGGGAGGCAGIAGSEGKGGGASIAVFVSDGAPTFIDSELVAKDGGAGGAGTFGSMPTAGGKGGAAAANAPASTAGGAGTWGGFAGSSGSGAGGPSIVIVHFGAAPSMERTTLTVGHGGVGAPAITQGTRTIAESPSGQAKEITSPTGA